MRAPRTLPIKVFEELSPELDGHLRNLQGVLESDLRSVERAAQTPEPKTGSDQESPGDRRFGLTEWPFIQMAAPLSRERVGLPCAA